jgi:ubiquinone/menaquinone biosynthesis C-methylase UbiE
MFFEIVNKHDGKFLEIGPGYGRLMIQLKENEKDIIGLEISEELITTLQSKGLNVLHGNVYKIPFKDSYFSCVCMEEVLEHLIDQDKAICEIHRVLISGGHLVISTPNKWIYRILMYASNMKNFKFSYRLLKNPTPGHVAELTLKGLKSKFKMFSDFKIVPMNNYLPKTLLKFLPFLAVGYIVIAKK